MERITRNFGQLFSALNVLLSACLVSVGLAGLLVGSNLIVSRGLAWLS